MKKMFVAFGIAIAVFCGMILIPSEEAQASEVYSTDEISSAIEQVLEYAIADYSEEYDELGITNVTVDRVMVITLPNDNVAIGILCTVEYAGRVISEVQRTIVSMSEVSEFMEMYGF